MNQGLFLSLAFCHLTVVSIPVGRIKGLTEEKCFEHPPLDLPGNCEDFTPDVYFNAQLNHCVKHIWGGCGDGGRGFRSIEECESACAILEEAARKASMKFPSKEPNCNLPAVTGPCKAYFHMWHYDALTGDCTDFVYGGCKGNANRFDSLQYCRDVCL